MDGDEDEKFPISKDLLALLWSKINVSPTDTLLSVLKTFYKADVIAKARHLFFRILPDINFRKDKQRKAEDTLKGLYELMQFILTEDLRALAAADINNISLTNVRSVDGAMLVSQ